MAFLNENLFIYQRIILAHFIFGIPSHLFLSAEVIHLKAFSSLLSVCLLSFFYPFLSQRFSSLSFSLSRTYTSTSNHPQSLFMISSLNTNFHFVSLSHSLSFFLSLSLSQTHLQTISLKSSVSTPLLFQIAT